MTKTDAEKNWTTITGIFLIGLMIAISFGYFVLYQGYTDWKAYCDNEFGKDNWKAVQVFGNKECGVPLYSMVTDCMKCEKK